MNSHAQLLWDLSQARADEIGKTLSDIAREANFTDQTVYQWRKGKKNISKRADTAISRAFHWEPGSRAAILAGGDPTPLTEEHRHTEPSRPAPPPAPSVPLDRTIVAILEGLDPDDQAEVLRRVAERLQAPPPPPDEEGPDRDHRDRRAG